MLLIAMCIVNLVGLGGRARSHHPPAACAMLRIATCIVGLTLAVDLGLRSTWACGQPGQGGGVGLDNVHNNHAYIIVSPSL